MTFGSNIMHHYERSRRSGHSASYVYIQLEKYEDITNVRTQLD